MFQNVAIHSLQNLKLNLEKRLPKCAQIYNALQFLINGSYPRTISTMFYAYNGNLGEGNKYQDMFIVAIQFREIFKDNAVILSSPDELSNEMMSAFESLINWKQPICFCAVDICISKTIAELCKRHGKLVNVDPCDLMTMSDSKVKNIQIQDNIDPSIQIKELQPSDCELVAKRWQFSQEGTEILMKDMIKYNGSAGVYFNGKLVSWVLIFAMGSINALYTETDYRKKGFGRLTMLKVCEIAGAKGLVPNVQVTLGNAPSKKLMESIGFTYSHGVEWVIYQNN